MKSTTYSAFSGSSRVAIGSLEEVLAAALEHIAAGYSAEDTPSPGTSFRDSGHSLLFFDDTTGRQVDFDLRGTLEEVIDRVVPHAPKRGPGRPKLGVRCNEVCLLPRHWEWLDSQPMRASGTIRRLVEQARKTVSPEERTAERIEAASRFMTVMAGNLIGFEEASRALFARKWVVFDRLIAPWPTDITAHLRMMLEEPMRESANAERSEYIVLPLLEAAGPRSHEQSLPVRLTPWRFSAKELAELISRGDVSATEVVRGCLERIRERNGEVNALTALCEREALETAERIDARRAAGEPIGPLAGVPFTVKANIDLAGLATTNGIPAMKDSLPPGDAPVIARLRAAGAIPIGHTNLPDLSLRFHTASTLSGHTRNPWDTALSPGGSSGGEAAAIASGMSALGVGNDAGGSVRIPAEFCGITALKPSFGRLPSDRGVGPRNVTLASQLIPVEGLLARSVADLHLAFQIVTGPDPRDPRVPPVPALLEERPQPGRVAVVEDPGRLGVCDGSRKAVALAAEALARAGYDVVAAELPDLSRATEAYQRMIMTEFSQSAALLSRLLGEDGRRYIGFAIAEGNPADLSGYLDMTAARQGIVREWAEFLERYPLVLGPVFTDELVPPDYDIRGLDEYRRIVRGMRLCSATSFVGVPAVAVPIGGGGSVPRGVQIIGGHYREDRCLEAASVLEAAFGRFSPPTG